MSTNHHSLTTQIRPLSGLSCPAGYRLVALAAAVLLSACGGGDPADLSSAGADTQTAVPLATGITTLALDLPELSEQVAAQWVQPTFRLAPTFLNPPDEVPDVAGSDSARRSARRHTVSDAADMVLPAELQARAIPDPDAATSAAGAHARAARSNSTTDQALDPLATGSTVTTYTPAQIRAAYGLPALPASGSTLSAAQAAQLGAGQTIYIIGARHNPNAAAELAAFNQKFGLPTCSTKSITTSTVLPLPSAAITGCELAVVYASPGGTLNATAPAYDAGWATEMALDVQWAHATAPLARIVLIESLDPSLDSLLGGIKLANAMGPGVVSMSFGTLEGSWTATVDAVFSAANMSYLAATGDSGASVSWPSVSTKVLAVGGTSLTYTGTGARSEVGWSGSGGGTSLYTPTPSYQTNSVPGLGNVGRRTVADVAFNADPSTGQYVAVIAPGTTVPKWIGAGGTSLSTPQWAGLIAIANGVRGLSAKATLGAPHAMLYSQIASVPGTYASAFADITQGTHGSCASCSTRLGYDALSGLGTPNVASLISALSGVAAAATAPVVASAGISGQVGTALTFTASASAANPVTYSLSGAPAGMVISAAGVVSWPTPVAGTYAVTVIAKDSKTGLSGQGIYTVTVAAPQAPVVSAATINGKVGTALSFTVAVTKANPVTFTLSGAPTGMSISSAGLVSWAAPVVGNYKVTVIAKDSKTGLSGQGVFTITIAAPTAPAVSSGSISGKPGTALSFGVTVTASNPVTYSLTGAPTGMSISSTGSVSWASPVLGSYSVTVVAKDSKTALTGRGVYSVKIATAGPVITAAAVKGVAGKPLSGSISITDPGATSLSISISGAPLGMGFAISGQTIKYSWASPVTGSYSLKISVVDSAGLSAQATLSVTVTAK